MITIQVKNLRDELYEALKKEFAGSKYFIRPRSPQKYSADEESTIVICYPTDTHQICGVQVQTKEGPFKIWFNDHPAWELETAYPVQVFGKNGAGAGSGSGFYIKSLNRCIAEIKDFLQHYYE